MLLIADFLCAYYMAVYPDGFGLADIRSDCTGLGGTLASDWRSKVSKLRSTLGPVLIYTQRQKVCVQIVGNNLESRQSTCALTMECTLFTSVEAYQRWSYGETHTNPDQSM